MFAFTLTPKWALALTFRPTLADATFESAPSALAFGVAVVSRGALALLLVDSDVSPVGGVKLRRLDSLHVHVEAALLRWGH